MGSKRQIPVETILASEEFPYVVAAWQAKSRKVPKYAFGVTDGNPYVVTKLKRILEATLGIPSYYSTREYPQGEVKKDSQILVVWSRSLMEFLDTQTQGNTEVPEELTDTTNKRRNYIRGFLDSRSCVSNSSRIVEALSFRLKYPSIVITKKNPRLLTSFYSLLVREGLSPSASSDSIGIYKHKDIRRIMQRGLITEPNRLAHLEEMCRELKDFRG